MAFTDGASLGNSTKKISPCGAGAIHLHPASPTTGLRARSQATAALGSGTNNQGEIWAIGMLVDLLAAYHRSNPAPGQSTAHLFSDSRLAILAVAYGAPARANLPLITAVRKKIAALFPTCKIIFRWMPAHVGIQGNEDADALASTGAQDSKRNVHMRDLPSRILSGHFIPWFEYPD